MDADTSGFIVDIWENLLSCDICQETFDFQTRAPRILSCFHSLCQDCLRKINQDGGVTCPMCRTHSTLLGSGTADRTRARLLEMVGQVQGRGGGPCCQGCQGVEEGEGNVLAEQRCIDCGHFLCADCASAHRRVNVTRNHRLLSLEEVASSPALLLQEPERCHSHPAMPLDLYCSTCSSALCYKCLLTLHKDGHTVVEIKPLADEKAEKVQWLCGELERLMPDLQAKARLSDQCLATAEQDVVGARQQIQQATAAIVAAAQARERELLAKLSNRTDGHVHRQRAQVEHFRSVLSAATTLSRHGRRLVGSRQHTQLLLHCPTMEEVLLDVKARASDAVLPPLSCQADIEKLMIVRDLIPNCGDVETTIGHYPAREVPVDTQASPHQVQAASSPLEQRKHHEGAENLGSGSGHTRSTCNLMQMPSGPENGESPRRTTEDKSSMADAKNSDSPAEEKSSPPDARNSDSHVEERSSSADTKSQESWLSYTKSPRKRKRKNKSGMASNTSSDRPVEAKPITVGAKSPDSPVGEKSSTPDTKSLDSRVEEHSSSANPKSSDSPTEKTSSTAIVENPDSHVEDISSSANAENQSGHVEETSSSANAENPNSQVEDISSSVNAENQSGHVGETSSSANAENSDISREDKTTSADIKSSDSPTEVNESKENAQNSCSQVEEESSPVEAKSPNSPEEEKSRSADTKSSEYAVEETPCPSVASSSDSPMEEPSSSADVKSSDSPVEETSSLADVKSSDNPVEEIPSSAVAKSSDNPMEDSHAEEKSGITDTESSDSPVEEPSSLADVKSSDSPVEETLSTTDTKSSDSPVEEISSTADTKSSDGPLEETSSSAKVKNSDSLVKENLRTAESKSSKSPVKETSSTADTKSSKSTVEETSKMDTTGTKGSTALTDGKPPQKSSISEDATISSEGRINSQELTLTYPNLLLDDKLCGPSCTVGTDRLSLTNWFDPHTHNKQAANHYLFRGTRATKRLSGRVFWKVNITVTPKPRVEDNKRLCELGIATEDALWTLTSKVAPSDHVAFTVSLEERSGNLMITGWRQKLRLQEIRIASCSPTKSVQRTLGFLLDTVEGRIAVLDVTGQRMLYDCTVNVSQPLWPVVSAANAVGWHHAEVKLEVVSGPQLSISPSLTRILASCIVSWTPVSATKK